MKKLLCIALTICCAITAAAQTAPYQGSVTTLAAPASGDLANFITSQAASRINGSVAIWVGYPLTVREKFSGVRSSTFHTGSWSGMSINGWRFEDEHSGIVRVGKRDKALLIRFERANGAIVVDDVAVAELDEPLRFTLPLLWLTGVSGDRSLDCIHSLVRSGAGRKQADDLAAAIALHEGERPVTLLREMLFNLPDRNQREDVLTWLGLLLAPERLNEIFALEPRLTDGELREHLTFIYARADKPEATSRLFTLAKNDPDEDVREQALFWLGQKARKKLGSESGDMLGDDQKSALFALRQRDSEASRKALLNVARTGKTPELRATALFWLCQEGDPIVIDYLEELLMGTAARR